MDSDSDEPYSYDIPDIPIEDLSDDQIPMDIGESGGLPSGEFRRHSEPIQAGVLLDSANVIGPVIDLTEQQAPIAVAEDVDTEEESSQSLLHVNLSRAQQLSGQPPIEENAASVSGIQQSPKKRPLSEDDNDDDGKTCPICLDNWTNLGDHRICALKCGHLFGLGCILRWFSIQRQRNCPTCKKKAAKNDIRYIYAKKLIAMDATELEEVKKRLDSVTQDKNRIQIELTRAICREHLVMQQVEDLKAKVKLLDTALEVKQKFGTVQGDSTAATGEVVRLYKDKSLEISKEAGCRVMDYFSNQELIVVSTKSPTSLFNGFGIYKINILTYKPTIFLPLHTKPIRDVRFHPENPWLLSVSLDKTIKIIDTTSNMSVFTTAGEVPLWSCCWDSLDSNQFFVGNQQGSVQKYDMRQPANPVCTLEVPGDMSPVVSVAAIAPDPNNAVPCGGIISCKLNSVWVFENGTEEYARYPLPLEGPFVSMFYENDSRHLLVSTRPNLRHPHSRYLLGSIENGGANNLLCNTIHCFTGSSIQKFLSRSCLVYNKHHAYVAAYQEVDQSVFLWNVKTGLKSTSFPAHEPVLDLCGVSFNHSNLVVSLSEKKLEFFKFV